MIFPGDYTIIPSAKDLDNLSSLAVALDLLFHFRLDPTSGSAPKTFRAIPIMNGPLRRDNQQLPVGGPAGAAVRTCDDDDSRALSVNSDTHPCKTAPTCGIL